MTKKSHKRPRYSIKAKSSVLPPLQSMSDSNKKGAKSKKSYFEHLEQQLSERQDQMAGVGMGNYIVDDNEHDSPEYSDEVGMVNTNIAIILKSLQELHNTIKDGENLPEWVQEKIAQAKGMIVVAADYLSAQHMQGIAPTNESSNNIKVYRQGDEWVVIHTKKGKQDVRRIPTDEADSREEAIKMAFGNGDTSTKKLVTPSNEGWTHDSLASKLFEQDLTYEDQLIRKLNGKLKK